MSKPQRRGKLRNPPRARQYAAYTVAFVVLVAVGSVAYLYATHDYGVFPATSSSASSTSASCTGSSSTSSGTKTGTYALICTNLGLIEVQLSSSSVTIQTVTNFVNLAKAGFYNGLVWHRIVPGFVIQSGDPNTRNGGGNRSTWGSGGSGTPIPFEDDPTLHNSAGTIAMASTGAGTGGSSQFYINLVDNSASLDGKYAVFGSVINGMSVVQALGLVPTNTATQQPSNASAATIVSITIQNTP